MVAFKRVSICSYLLKMKTSLIIFLFVFATKAMGQPHPVTVGAILSTTTADQRECVWNCEKTPQYDPICGTDGTRYYNKSYLECAQSCGVDVQPTHPPPCSGTTTTTSSPWPSPPQRL